MTFYSISFCTVCMNRTLHLKETLIKNIRDNSAYPNLEYVLLNYGSKDEMPVIIHPTGHMLEL